MLPNWLYGKSKSKLASILGGGGAPADYNQVKAQVTQNAEDIELLSDTKAALTQITNPNLLDNPWFTVNQRGQSSYTSQGYTVDRWRTEGNSADFSIDIMSDGVHLKRNVPEGYIALSQLSEASLLIPSKEYTLSILYSDGTVKFNTFTVPAYEQSYLRIVSTQSYMGCQAIIDRSADGLYNIIILHDGDISTIPAIRAVKLELGSVSTLAMDTAPNYATELLKCRRYFEKIIVFEHNILDTQASYDRDYHITPKRTNGTLTAYSVNNNTAGKISFYINNQWEDGDYSVLAWDSPLYDTIRFGVQIPAGTFFKGIIVISADL